MNNRQQYVQFNNGLIETLDSLCFKSDSREIDPTINNGRTIPQMYSLAAIAKTVEQNTYHKVAIETVSTDICSNGYEIDCKEELRESSIYNKVIDFLSSLDIPEVSYEAAFEYRLYGQLFLEVIKDKYDGQGSIKSLNILQGKYMYKTIDERVFVSIVNGKSTYFKNGEFEGSELIDVNYKTGAVTKRGGVPEQDRASEVYFKKSYNPNSINYGLPIAVNIMTTIVGDLKRGENNLNFFLRGGVPKYLITITGNFDNMLNRSEVEADPENVIPVYMEEWLENEMRVIESQNNPNGAMVLTLQNNGQEIPINVQFQQISSNTGEASHREYRKDNRDEILAAHQVPVYRLGIAETGSLGETNIVEQNKIYNRKVISPLQSSLALIINKLIKYQFGEEISKQFVFRFKEIDLEDDIQKFNAKLQEHQFYLSELQAGVIDIEYYYELTGKDFSKYEQGLKEESIYTEEQQKLIDKLNGIEA